MQGYSGGQARQPTASVGRFVSRRLQRIVAEAAGQSGRTETPRRNIARPWRLFLLLAGRGTRRSCIFVTRAVFWQTRDPTRPQKASASPLRSCASFFLPVEQECGWPEIKSLRNRIEHVPARPRFAAEVLKAGARMSWRDRCLRTVRLTALSEYDYDDQLERPERLAQARQEDVVSGCPGERLKV